MSELRALLEQEQKKLDLLKRVSQIDDKYRKELEAAISESGLSRDTLPFSVAGAGIVGILKNTSIGPYAGLSIPEATRRFLQERDPHTASTPEIAQGLLAGGLTTTSRNFTATVYTVLSQTPRWFKRKGKSWTLSDEGAKK
jgi:hypothetical protein